jgi:L-asparaginase II
MLAKVLANVYRGKQVESIHRGHWVLVDGKGSVIAFEGDPEYITFTRSAAKPFQAVPLIASGAADDFGFQNEEIALACASHSGEPLHLATVEKMLAKAGFETADLQCGAHFPFNENEAKKMIRADIEPTPLHNNCSGKHAGFLALAKKIGADPKEYLLPESPVQTEVLKAISSFTSVPVSEIITATDGCSAPNFALPLSAIARGFAKLINPDSVEESYCPAARKIFTSMSQNPFLVGGSERLDTLLMQAARYPLISKVGAEGVWAAAVSPFGNFPQGVAIALKLEDGDDYRARPAIAAKILAELRVISTERVDKLLNPTITSRRGEKVGTIEPLIDLNL